MFLLIPLIISVVLAFAAPWPGILIATPVALLFLGCIVGSERIRIDARSRKDHERRSSLELMNAIHQKVDDLHVEIFVERRLRHPVNLPPFSKASLPGPFRKIALPPARCLVIARQRCVR